MRELNGIVQEIVDDMLYLKERESCFQFVDDVLTRFVNPALSTQLSIEFKTNERVQILVMFTIIRLIALGVRPIFLE